MTHKLITTENYLLVVDDSEIKVGDWLYGYSKKIIAHLPLNNSPILEGVDLLPPLEDEVEKLAKEYANGTSDIDVPYTNGLFYGFLEGYNKAKAKYKYTEEDVIKRVEKSRETGLTAEYLMLSLQQPKMPVGFLEKGSYNGTWVGRYIY